MWFEELFGFKEENPEQVRKNLTLESNKLISKINGKDYQCGTLEILTLRELKRSAAPEEFFKSKISLTEIVGDAQELHKDIKNRGALFQVASQFNLLEMIAPDITPERGVEIYEHDHTQGPSCAIACGAGTVYRNYFVRLGNQIGQTRKLQVDCLEELGKVFENESSSLWNMQNGYALANEEGLQNISQHIRSLDATGCEALKETAKTGIQWHTEVTISPDKQQVSQIYCSALPVAYSHIASKKWKDFAKLILDATYEATFYAALKNYIHTGNRTLFLTLIGGGAFGNEQSWIFDAIEKAVNKFRNTPIDAKIVSYGRSNPAVRAFVKSVNRS